MRRWCLFVFTAAAAAARVYVHVSKLCVPGVLHVGVSVCDAGACRRFDFGPFRDSLEKPAPRHGTTLLWGTTARTLDDADEFASAHRRRYVLGWYDCRHFVRDFTQWSVGRPTPVWTLHRLLEG